MTDAATRRQQLNAVRGRLSNNVTAVAGALAAYIEFTDALTAAGLSQALGEDGVPDLLRHAGRAGLLVFETRGSQDLVVTDLDTGETIRKPDTSAANPTTVVQALLAALASGDTETAASLAEVPPEDLQTDQAPAPPVILVVATALQRAAVGDRASVRRLTADPVRDASIYGEMLRQLDRWARGDAVDVDQLRHADTASWLDAGYAADDPIVLLGLPALGLSALSLSERSGQQP